MVRCMTWNVPYKWSVYKEGEVLGITLSLLLQDVDSSSGRS